MRQSGEVIKRRNHPKTGSAEDELVQHYTVTSLNLLEEIFILALDNGKISYWNESLSTVLRGCILIELSLRERIALEPKSPKKLRFGSRKLLVMNEAPTGERLLDETLKLMRESPEQWSLEAWLELLCGENWNPWNWKYHLKNVKERIAKDLAEKGMVTNKKMKHFFYDFTSHELNEEGIRVGLVEKLQRNLLAEWKVQLQQMDTRCLALILMTVAADLQDNIFDKLALADYNLIKRRLNLMVNVDYEQLAKHDMHHEVAWAVFAILIK